MITIENATIAALAVRSEVAEAFPRIFGPFKTALEVAGKSNCQCPQVKAHLAEAYEAAKRALVGLTEPDRRQLKAFLKTDKVQVILLQGKNGFKHVL